MENYITYAQKCLQYIYYIFIACARSDLLPSFHKIKLFSKLRYVLGARPADLLYSKLVQFCLLDLQR